MPSWKKVITSGSDAELNSLYAPSITGSLLGTASYANSANSSSYAITASFITSSNVYGPYGSNSIVSASYAETASSATNTQDILIRVLNQSGQNISKGLVVHITASSNSSDIPRVITASYENDNNSANTLGITTEAIANGSEGFVMTEGVLKGIDTSAFQSGQLIYLGATGSIIGTAPVAPLHNVRLGQVVRVQSINGSIYVRVDNGYELEELHDILIVSASAGDLLVRDGNVWNNLKQLTGSYGLTGSLSVKGDNGLRVTRTGGTEQYIDINQNVVTSGAPAIYSYSTASNAKTLYIGATTDTSNTPVTSGTVGIQFWTMGTSSLFIDASQSVNIGLGSATASAKLHVNNTTTNNSFLVEDSTNPDTTPFVINNAGNVGIGLTTPIVPLHIKAPSQTGVNESILRLEVGDAAGAYLGFNNASLTDNLFVPEIIGRQSSATSQSGVIVGAAIDSTQDSGTIPATIFRSALVTLAPISTRPLFDFRNWSTSVMTIAANGNVGIGTTSPISKLTVSASGVDGILIGTDTSAGNQERSGRLFFGQQDPLKATSIFASSGSMFFSTLASASFSSGTTRMVITLSGSVGIGTTNPAAKLDVQDTSATLGTSSGSYYLLTTFAGRVGGTNDFHHDEYRLRDATGSSWFTSRLHDAISIDTSYKTPGVDTRVWWERDPWDNIQSWGNTTNTYMTINNGDIGIGTATPYAKLDIIPSDGVDGILLNTSPVSSSQSARLMFGSATTASNTPMIFASSGNLQFHTGGTPHVSSGTTKLFISSSENVGIGTSTPTLGTLQVNGNVYASSFTGSLQGTASNASFAQTASYINPLTQSVNISGSLTLTGSFNASSYPNKILSITEVSNNLLISHSVGTTNFTAINLNSDGTNRYAKTSFVAPLSGQVQITMEFDMIIVNSAAVQMIGLHNTSSATSTPSDGWYRVNADNDSTSGQFYANFTKTGLTPGTTYTYYFMGVCNFSGNLVRASAPQTGSYSAGADLPSPLRIYVYDLGPSVITTNPSS